MTLFFILTIEIFKREITFEIKSLFFIFLYVKDFIHFILNKFFIVIQVVSIFSLHHCPLPQKGEGWTRPKQGRVEGRRWGWLEWWWE